MVTDAPIPKQPFADEVAALSDTIRVCERLCLLSARTVLRSAVALESEVEKQRRADEQKKAKKGEQVKEKRKEKEKPPLAFIPSISRDLQNLLPGSAAKAGTPGNPHPTTTAHCITALQGLLPVIGRFQLGTHESKGLAFHPIERATADAFRPNAMNDEIRSAIERALRSLTPPEAASEPGKAGDIAPNTQQSTPSSDTKADRQPHEVRSTFRPLHPFRAAQILRALAPSHAVFHPMAWKSLFAVVWFLNRRSGSLRGFPSIQATDSPGTAFLTSKCVEAIETVLSVFERRRNRFRRLFELMSQLHNITDAREESTKMEGTELGYGYMTSILIPEIRACLNELACDSALPATYSAWNSCLLSMQQADPSRRDRALKLATDFLVEVVSSFRQAMHGKFPPPVQGKGEPSKSVAQEHAETRAWTEKVATDLGQMVQIVTKIRGLVRWACDAQNKINAGSRASAAAAGAKKPENLPTLAELYKLPKWICSEDYWVATERLVEPKSNQEAEQEQDAEFGAILNTLELHWARHQEAAENALKTVQAFANYLLTILNDFESLKQLIPPKPTVASVKDFLEKTEGATGYITALHRQLSNDLDIGVRWAEVVMNRHLAYAASGTMAYFDPSELAHAVRVMCRDSGRVRFALILKALQVVASAQRADGTWSCQQPFYWRETGFALWTMSMETAAALVSIVHLLVMNPEQYGTGPTEISTELQPIYHALDRFFRWLSGSLVSLRAPPALVVAEATAQQGTDTKARTELPLYGWCSDRLPESERIHSWATAIGIEFLVQFRRLMQDRINAILRTEFLSHPPSELPRLSEVEPTDLRNARQRGEEGPVIARLLKLLREHKYLELIEGPWVPTRPHDIKISFWSALLYGPPGTSKTHLAKAIAGELGWPLISVSPSDFLAKGDAYIEPRAQEIFSAFSAGTRLVFFFDEIDELIRDRKEHADHRSALSFLTPSFLTKLQDFRDGADRNEYIFLLATNYKDRIDSAAIRSGRIDQLLPIVYPDKQSRAYIIIRQLAQSWKKENLRKQLIGVGDYFRGLQECLRALYPEAAAESFLDNLAEFSGFLSYQKIRALLKFLPDNNFAANVREARKRELDQLIKQLSAIGQVEAGRYQPEINLAEYAERPGAYNEIELLTKVIPHTRFPWPTPAQRSLLQRQLEGLHGKISTEKRLADFKQRVAKLMRSASRASARPAPRRRSRR
jgi:SpoVK/Ycf46/Vps4 family AAA+-type ATPase